MIIHLNVSVNFGKICLIGFYSFVIKEFISQTSKIVQQEEENAHEGLGRRNKKGK